MAARSRYTATEVELLDQLDPDERPLSFALELYHESHVAAGAALLALHRDGLLEMLGAGGTTLRDYEIEQALRDDGVWSAEPQLSLRLTDLGAAFIS